MAHPFPHTYSAAASGDPSGTVLVDSPDLPGLETAAPKQFDGPGGLWSPETLLCAALADCFILTFRAVSRAAHLKWLRLECEVRGLLDRVEHQSRFTHFTTFASLLIPPDVDPAVARKLLAQAEHGCLIGNSLVAQRAFEAQVSRPGIEHPVESVGAFSEPP